MNAEQPAMELPSPPGRGRTLLSVRNLRVRFGSKDVVHGVSFDLAAGEKLALVGESGSGKTITALSLLRLAGDAQLGGQALFDGRDLLRLPEREMRAVRGGDVAMIFQEPMTALNPLMTVGEQVGEVLRLKQGLTRAQSLVQATELLATTGIAGFATGAGASTRFASTNASLIPGRYTAWPKKPAAAAVAVISETIATDPAPGADARGLWTRSVA